MSRSGGRPALAVSRPDPPRTAGPPWATATAAGLVDQGLASAATVLVGDARGAMAYASWGDALPGAGGGRPLFDLASLTKPWTASLALRLEVGGKLPLGLEIGELWPRCDRRLARRTLEDLLRHRGGFQPWAPLYHRCQGPEETAGVLLEGDLLGARRGTYSDLGYILWGLSASRVLGRSLAALLEEELVTPLGLESAATPGGGAFWVPCRLDSRREVELAAAQGVRLALLGPPAAGQAQDGNARFLGAPAGHAGLFATPWAMLALAREWLAPGALWPAAAVARALAGPGPFALGWRRATRRGSAGPALGPRAFGHVGFTGGSVWIDPDRKRALILLAHRTGTEVDLAPARRRFHRLALDARQWLGLSACRRAAAGRGRNTGLKRSSKK